MRDGRTLQDVEKSIRLAVSRIGLPVDTPEFNEAIRQLAEALTLEQNPVRPAKSGDVDESRPSETAAGK